MNPTMSLARQYRLGPALLFVVWIAPAAWTAAAEDVVYLTSEAAGRGTRKVSGQVMDFTGRELRIRISTGKERAIPFEQVDRVETAHCAEHAAGDELFVDRDFRAAAIKYRAALENDREVRGWVRREILAQVVWCLRAIGQWDQAGEFFLALLARDPPTQYFECIPLAWGAVQVTPALERKAKTWLAMSDQPAAGLMGASFLLATSGRLAALEKLKLLQSDEDPRVAWLARAQIWRTTAMRASGEELQRWSDLIESSPESLRAGPYFVLGSALAGKQPASASIALLKLPILYPRERQLAAAALLTAGGCLEKTGQPAQATGLYRELIEGYAGSSETNEAQRRLQALDGGPAKK